MFLDRYMFTGRIITEDVFGLNRGGVKDPLEVKCLPRELPKIKNPRKLVIFEGFNLLVVIPLGLEPRAHTLKVYCSTN